MSRSCQGPVLDAIMGIACAPCQGAIVDLKSTAYAAANAVVKAAMYGHCSFAEASAELAERLDGATQALDVDKIQGAMESLRLGAESVISSSSGTLAFIWAKVSNVPSKRNDPTFKLEVGKAKATSHTATLMLETVQTPLKISSGVYQKATRISATDAVTGFMAIDMATTPWSTDLSAYLKTIEQFRSLKITHDARPLEHLGELARDIAGLTQWIPFGIDNQSFEKSAQKSWSRAERLNLLLKRLFVLQIKFDCHVDCLIRFFWLKSEDNSMADPLSCEDGLEAFLAEVQRQAFVVPPAVIQGMPDAGRVRNLDMSAPFNAADMEKTPEKAPCFCSQSGKMGDAGDFYAERLLSPEKGNAPRHAQQLAGQCRPRRCTRQWGGAGGHARPRRIFCSAGFGAVHACDAVRGLAGS
jgi:hypothetical protein